MMQPKRIWILLAEMAVLFGAFWIVLAGTQSGTRDAGVPAGLSESEVTQLARDALKTEYAGSPVQIMVKQTTVGELDKFDCGKIGAMISAIVSPLQGNRDICAPDSTLWVVSLHGEFQHEGFVTDSVQVILDRGGRMMSMDSGELTSISW
jgi:hypothetical protein